MIHKHVCKKITMSPRNSIDEIFQAIRKVKHPALDEPLVDLGMIRDFSYSSKDNAVSLTLVLPLMRYSHTLRERLIDQLNQAVRSTGAELTTTNLVEMKEAERRAFFLRVQESNDCSPNTDTNQKHFRNMESKK